MATGAPALSSDTLIPRDQKDPQTWRTLVAQAGGVEVVARVCNLKRETVQRYLAGTELASAFHVNRLAKFVREQAGGVSVQPSAAQSSAGAAFGQAAPTRPSGFAPVETVADFAEEPEPEDDRNLSFFPPRPKRSDSKASPRKTKPPTVSTLMGELEAAEYRDLLIEVVLPWLAEQSDNLIFRTVKAREAEPDPIWFDLEEREYVALADAMLGTAMQFAPAAQAVRGLVYVYRRYEVGLITIPRMWKTLDYYADHGGIALSGILPTSFLRALNPRRPRRGGPS